MSSFQIPDDSIRVENAKYQLTRDRLLAQFPDLDDETLAFAEIAGGKSRTNLEVTNKVAAAAFKTAAGCQVKGIFQGFQSGGPLFDEYAQLIKQTGTSARWMSNVQEVGIIKVQEVT